MHSPSWTRSANSRAPSRHTHGLATGDLLTREGDYYGVEVNLAARLADIAVPQEILVSTDTKRLAEKDDVDDVFAFEPAGRRALKGFATPVEVFSLGRA